MKTIFISLILAMALPFISYASKTQINDNGDVVIIPINKPGDGKEENNPRNSIFSPITCYYCNCVFYFTFYETFEDVTITIENITTGEQLTKSLDYSDSLVRIPVSSTDGTFHLSIQTDIGLYTGAFCKVL